MLVSFLLFVISLFIPAKSDVINQVNSYSSDISEIPVFEKINFSYNGVSFSYLDNWEITDNSDIEGGLGHNINIEKKGINSSGLITITWLNQELDDSEMMELMRDEISSDIIYKNVIFTENQMTTFKGEEGVKTNYKFSI